MSEPIEKKLSSYFDECAREGLMESFSSEELKKLDTAINRWNIRPGQRVLEPGCGAGRLTVYLVQAVGFAGEVFACDISREMISRAKKRNLPEQAVFHHGSVNSIPRKDGYFDKIICFAVFPHLSDATAALAEMHRVLKPGGDLWIEHFSSREVINAFHENAGGILVSHRLPLDDEMRKLLGGAGFEIAGMNNSELGYWVHTRKPIERSRVLNQKGE